MRKNVLAPPGVSLGLLARLLANLLSPHGAPLPPGEHISAEPWFSRIGLPEGVVRFGLQTYSPDEAPLGKYVATSDPSTRFMIDGHARPLDEALERLGEHQGYVRLVAEAPGKLALLEYSTGEPRDG